MAAMRIIAGVEEARAFRRGLSGVVGLVPTMGYLHDGHVALMHEARERCDHVLVSVFVNPTQFGPNEDLANYPRDLEGGIARCEGAGVAMVFTPTAGEMYPAGHVTQVRVGGVMTEHLCGASRPGHFDGVALVVSKLFNILTPDVAVFGEKDYQQLAVIRRMVSDLNMGVEVVGVLTVREADGLARSSRNRYLEGEDRARARALSHALALVWGAWQRGERVVSRLVGEARAVLGSYGVVEDYVEVVDAETLARCEGELEEGARVVMALAARVGPARLIDNLRLDGALPRELWRDGL